MHAHDPPRTTCVVLCLRHTTAVLDEAVPFYDLSRIGNEERFFFDTDHLNRAGVRNLLDVRLGNILRDHLTRTVPDGP